VGHFATVLPAAAAPLDRDDADEKTLSRSGTKSTRDGSGNGTDGGPGGNPGYAGAFGHGGRNGSP